MVKKPYLILKAIIMIFAVISLCSTFTACSSIKLEGLPLDSNYGQVTSFQIIDDTIYYTSESMAIGYYNLSDNSQDGAIHKSLP